MPVGVDPQTGAPVDLDPASLTQGVLEGSVSLPADKRVPMRRPDGALVTVDPTEFAEKVSGGYSVLSDAEVQEHQDRKEFGSDAAAARAFVEAAASDASFGLTDYAQGELLDNKDEIRKRRELNPNASAAGSVTGIVGSMLLSGGGSGVLRGALKAGTAPARGAIKLGAAVERGVGKAIAREATEQAGSIAARAFTRGASVGAGGMAEGALFGAAKAVNDAYLTDTELTAERVAFGAGYGALLGGAAGAVLGGGGAALSGVAKRATEPAAAWVRKNLNAKTIADHIEQFQGERAVKAALGGRNARQLRKAGATPEDIAARGNRLREYGVIDATTTVDDIADRAIALRRDAGDAIGRIVRQVDEAGVKVPGGKLADELEGVVRRFSRDPEFASEAASLSRLVKPVTQHLRGKRGMSFGDLWERRKAWDTKHRKALEIGSPDKPISGPIKEIRDIMEANLRDLGEQASREVGGEDFAQQWISTKLKYADAVWADEATAFAMQRDINNRWMSLTDYFGMGAGMELVGEASASGLLSGAFAMGLVHRLMRKRGSAIVSGMVDSAGRHFRGKAMRQATAGEMAIENAAEKLALNVEAGRLRSSRADQAAVLLGVDVGTSDAPAAYEALSRRIHAMQDPSSPERQRVQQHVGAIASDSPALAGAYSGTVQRAANYLASQLPEPPVEPGLFSRFDSPILTRGELETLKRQVNAVENPRDVLSAIEDGSVTPEEVDALRAVYPRMYARLIRAVADGLGRLKEPPSYHARLHLSQVLGVPVDESMRPEFIAAMQQTASVPIEPPAQSALAPSRRKAPDELAAMSATPTGRLARQ